MPDRPVHAHIKTLSQVLVRISEQVVKHLFHALDAVKHQDDQGARQFRLDDYEIDVAEVDLEERCLRFLALQHPVAKDLRTIITIIKINDDLERIGKLALHIIERMHDITPEMMDSFGLETMGIQAGEMVSKSIEAFISENPTLAHQVCTLDETINAAHRSVFNSISARMKEQDADVDQLISALSISRYIERLADHATRIAHEVIYLVTGEIIMHKEGFYSHLITSFSGDID